MKKSTITILLFISFTFVFFIVLSIRNYLVENKPSVEKELVYVEEDTSLAAKIARVQKYRDMAAKQFENMSYDEMMAIARGIAALGPEGRR